MRRLIALSLVLLYPGPTAAQSLRVSVADLGAVPGPDGADATYAAICRALATPVPGGSGKVRTVYFPGGVGDWYLPRPIVADDGSTAFEGDGPASVLRMLPGRTDPVLILGVGRKPGGRALTPDHFVDAFGRLDATAAPTPGVRYGFRTLGNSRIVQCAGPLANGPPPADPNAPAGYYGDLAALTIDHCQDTTDPATAAGGWTFGLPGVFQVYTGPDQGSLWFWTADGPGAAPALNTASWPGLAPGVNRLAIQLDLDGRTVTVYLNGAQVAVRQSWRGAPGSRARLAPNQAHPYCLGSVSDQAPTGIGGDGLTLGHRLTARARYAVGAPGDAQRRLDGKAITDLATYFGGGPGAIAYLPFADPPASAGERLLQVVAPNAYFQRSSALVLSPEHGSNWAAQRDFAIRKMQVLGCRGPGLALPYGDAVAIGNALDCEFSDCTISGGARAIACLNWLANYTNRVRRCTLQGDEAALYLYQGTWDVEDVRAYWAGRNTLWAVMSSLDGRRIFVGDGGMPERIAFNRGGNLRIDGLNLDIEGGKTPTRCVAESILDPALGEGVLFTRLRDWALGGLKPGIPLVVLGRDGTWGPRGRLDLAGWRAIGDTDKECIVRVDGDNWSGAVDWDYATPSVPVVKVTTPAGSLVTRVGPSAPAPAPMPMPTPSGR